MIATKTPSVEEFLRTPENDRCEYAHGEQWEKPLHNRQHAESQALLGSALVQYGRESGNGEPFSAWHHRFGPEDDKRIYVPDLAFVCAPPTYPSPCLRRSRIRCNDRDCFPVRIRGPPDRKGRVLSPKRSKKCLGCRSTNAAYRRLRAGEIHAYIRTRRHADRRRSARLRAADWRCLSRSVKRM